nr:hypothetical protein GCM10020092_070980 [Actinoplanes digitatis]
MTPPAGGVVGAALADAGAAVHGLAEVAVVVRVRHREPLEREAPGGPDVGVDRVRLDKDARVEQVAGVERVLDPREQGDGVRGVHVWQQLRAGPAVAVLAGERAAELADELGRVGEELAQHRRPAGPVERVVEPHVHAPVAEVAERRGRHAVGGDEVVEAREVGAEPLRRHGGVLPAGPGGLVRRRPA